MKKNAALRGNRGGFNLELALLMMLLVLSVVFAVNWMSAGISNQFYRGGIAVGGGDFSGGVGISQGAGGE